MLVFGSVSTTMRDFREWVEDLEEEIDHKTGGVLAENLVRGFYPSVAESYNTGCERKAFGMGRDDHTWSKLCVYVHRSPGDCENEGCSDCEEAVLHECGEMFCPDTAAPGRCGRLSGARSIGRRPPGRSPPPG